MNDLRYYSKKKRNITKRITFFGDSITAHEHMYVTNFTGMYNSGNVIWKNWAVGGASVMHIPTKPSYWGDQIVFSKNDNPYLVIILIGINDPYDTFFPIEYKRNIQLIKEYHTKSNIVVMGILDYNQPINVYRSEKNTWIEQICQEEGVIFLNTDGWINPVTDTTDGAHPNSSGSIKIATRLMQGLGG